MPDDNEAIRSRLVQAVKNAMKEIAPLMKTDILKAFDNEHGYHEDGSMAKWDELSPDYVRQKPPRGRGGSSSPILNFEGDLRRGIDVRTSGFILFNEVVSSVMKARGKGDTIPVEDISSILGATRPHTNPSKKFMDTTIPDILNKHLLQALDELVSEGKWRKNPY